MLSANSEKSQLKRFEELCEERTGRSFEGPTAFHSFSVEQFREFWRLFLEWSEPLRSGEVEPVCTDDSCESATFFPNLRLNYAENLLEPREPGADERIALVARRGDGSRGELSRRQLREQVRRVAGHLRALGVGRDDRVVAIAPNGTEAIVAALAAATLGATFSSAAPEMGAPAILSRFGQLAPKLLFAGGGSDSLGEVIGGLPTLETVLLLDDDTPKGSEVPVLHLDDLLSSPPPQPLPEGWERFPFNHPLFILFTSLTVAMDLRFRHDSRCVRGKPHNTRGPGPSRKTQESSPIVYDVDVMTVGGGSTKSHGRIAERASRQAGADAVGVEANDFSLLIGGEDAPIRAEGEVVHLKVCVNFRRAGSAIGQNRHAQNRSRAGDGNVSGSAKELDAIGANGQSSGRRD